MQQLDLAAVTAVRLKFSNAPLSKKHTNVNDKSQFQRFKDIARELGADESQGAMDRAFGQIDAKQTKPRKRAAAQKRKR